MKMGKVAEVSMSQCIIIDTDPGVDDALALIYASNVNLSVKGLTMVYGNASIENVTANAGYITRALGNRWGIYKGAAKPLVGKGRLAKSHGLKGLGEVLPNQRNIDKPSLVSAFDFLKQEFETSDEITIFCLGPLTNIAVLLGEPSLPVEKISNLIIIGGAFSENGNVTEVAEFNVYNDPDAFNMVADIVVKRKIDAVIIPVEVCRQVVMTVDDLEKLGRGSLAIDLQKIVKPYLNYYLNKASDAKHAGAVLYDVLAPLYYQYPQLFTSVNGRVSVNCEQGPQYGATKFLPDSSSTLKVCTAIRADDARDAFMKGLGSNQGADTRYDVVDEKTGKN